MIWRGPRTRRHRARQHAESATSPCTQSVPYSHALPFRARGCRDRPTCSLRTCIGQKAAPERCSQPASQVSPCRRSFLRPGIARRRPRPGESSVARARTVPPGQFWHERDHYQCAKGKAERQMMLPVFPAQTSDKLHGGARLRPERTLVLTRSGNEREAAPLTARATTAHPAPPGRQQQLGFLCQLACLAAGVPIGSGADCLAAASGTSRPG